jgi:hypothetical protein
MKRGDHVSKNIRMITLKSLKDLLFILDGLASDLYVFRGQSDSSWGLKSSFERAAENIDPNSWSILEENMLLEFKRHAHHFLKHVPKDDSLVEWLAIMQHYGCPTRLLDFTRSPYIALFFAIENASNNSAIWAIDTKSYTGSPHVPLWDKPFSSTYDAGSEDQANRILNHSEDADLEPGVIAVEPLRLNERISIQQGLFLFPKKMESSFEENLRLPSGITPLQELKDTYTSFDVLKVIIPNELHDPIAYWLEMFNVTARSLFPGLEGYARSFTTYIKRSRHKNREMNELFKEAAAQGLKNLGSAFEGMNQL